MRLEQRIDVAGDAGSVVSQGHSGAAHDEYVCHDAPANEALAQRGKCPFKLCPAKEDTVGLAHAAWYEWCMEWSPAFQFSRRPGTVRSQSGRISRVTLAQITTEVPEGQPAQNQ